MVKKKKPSPKKKKRALPPKRKGLALWLGLIFFVSIWMFILGIFVGRGTIPVQFDIEKLHKELATLKAEFIKKEQDRFNSPGDQTGNKTELRFYEVLKKSRMDDKLDTEIISKPVTGPLPETADTDEKKTGALQGSETTGALQGSETTGALQGSETTGALQGSETTGAPLKSDPNVAEKKPAVKTDPEHPRAMQPQGAEATGTSRKSAPGFTEKQPGTGIHLTLQVASFKDPKIADTMVEDLIRKGYPAYRTIGDIRGKGTWFRVRIGTFKNRDAAGVTLARLKKDGIKAILVRR